MLRRAVERHCGDVEVASPWGALNESLYNERSVRSFVSKVHFVQDRQHARWAKNKADRDVHAKPARVRGFWVAVRISWNAGYALSEPDNNACFEDWRSERVLHSASVLR